MSLLSADSLGVRAADGTALLADVSLEVGAGETLLLCGPPGSGKTLLAKALKGLLDDREDLAVSGAIGREGSIGYVFQDPKTQLVRRRVRHDVAFGLENRGLPVAEIEARIDEYASLLEATDLLDRRVAELSRGEAATVALLGIVATEPDGVILDEPLAPLDRRSAARLLAAIDRLREAGATVVVAEHDARDLLSRADRAALLSDGRLAGAGPPRAMLRDMYAAGVRLPTGIEIALELGDDGSSVPLVSEDSGVELP